jgi:hypothetical protein
MPTGSASGHAEWTISRLTVASEGCSRRIGPAIQWTLWLIPYLKVPLANADSASCLWAISGAKPLPLSLTESPCALGILWLRGYGSNINQPQEIQIGAKSKFRSNAKPQLNGDFCVRSEQPRAESGQS